MCLKIRNIDIKLQICKVYDFPVEVKKKSQKQKKFFKKFCGLQKRTNFNNHQLKSES